MLTRVVCQAAQLLFDTDELVIFGHTVGTGSGAGFDLSAIKRHGEVGNGIIFRFAGPVRHNGIVPVMLCQGHGIYRFRKTAYLVHLHQQRIGYLLFQSLL